MRKNFQSFQGFKEVEMAHGIAVHALGEYREWRDNSYIGQHLGSARDVYLSILRRRVHAAIEAYKLVRDAALYPVFHKAA